MKALPGVSSCLKEIVAIELDDHTRVMGACKRGIVDIGILCVDLEDFSLAVPRLALDLGDALLVVVKEGRVKPVSSS